MGAFIHETKSRLRDVSLRKRPVAVTRRAHMDRFNGGMHWLLSLLMALLAVAAGPAAAKPFANSGFESIAGVQVHVRHWPAEGAARGCPVLLLHGFGGSTFSFRELAPALAAAGHEVWALDLPAYGYSARTPFPGTAGAALAPWLDAKGSGWCLLGHSMGTRVVAELVLARPGDVASVVYLAGNPIPSAKELRSRDRFKSPRLRRWLARLVESRYLHEERIGELLEKAYGRPASEAEVAGYLTPLREPGTALAIMNGYAAQWPATPTGDALDDVPTLILWGENDAWVKPEVADRLQAALPSARRVTIAGAGHCPMETQVAQTRDAVLAQFAPGPP
jgi:pimeloyl-ACP methyl ester carboxylesterase